ncbi:MAG: 3-keto-5-aminohexanoate cleavage protein [Hyphomicrobium sp.]|nr:3-keto-5-aminohexanoate cleavage protein [Hyphomicrobium sp.]
MLDSYGLPEAIDPEHTKYGHGFQVQNKWKVPDKVMITQTITGAFYSKRGNPNHPISKEEILEQSLAVADAGAPNIHIHVRGEDGHNILCPKTFHYVIDPVRKYYPDRIISACMVPFQKGEWAKMIECLQDGLMDETPINTVAAFCGDTLFAKPPHVMIEKARILSELNCKAQIAVYSDGDIDNADRYLIKTGALKPPYYWVILPNLPGGSPMQSPKAMVEVLMHYVNRIQEIDKDSEIVVCASGRAGTYLASFAMLLGLNIRIGMEDTVWQYPHKDDKIKKNLDTWYQFSQMARLLGRDIYTAEEFKKKLGMVKPGGILRDARTNQPVLQSMVR